MSHDTNHEFMGPESQDPDSQPPLFPASLFEEVHFLASSSLGDDLTDQQAARLEQLVVENPAARRLLACYLITNASLHEWVAAEGAPLPWSSTANRHDSEMELLVSTESIRELLEEDAEVEQRKAEESARIETLAAEKFAAFRQEQNRNHRPEPVAASRNTFYATVSSLAAAAILFILWMLPEPAPQQTAFVAKIIGTSGLVWANGGTAMPPETSLQKGQLLDLEAGLLEVEFKDGARVILEGPAQFAVQSRGAGDLQLGKLVAHVPSEAHGFLIQTPGMEIVDLGTEFGVVVDVENKSQVRVFTGLVNLQAVDKKKRAVESLLLRPGTTIEVASPSSASAQADASGSVFKQIASIPKLKRTLLAKDQEVFTDDFSQFHAGRYSKHNTFRQGGVFDFEQGRLNLRPAERNTITAILSEPGIRLRRGMQFSASMSANESGNRRVGLLISTFSGQPDGKANFGFRLSFDDQDIWAHAYEKPSDHQLGSDAQVAYIGKGPETAVHKLPKGPLTLSVEWVGDTTFKFYCQSRGSPDRLLVDTRSIEALKDFSELYVGVQCYRKQDLLIGRCSRLTIGPIERVAE